MRLDRPGGEYPGYRVKVLPAVSATEVLIQYLETRTAAIARAGCRGSQPVETPTKCQFGVRRLLRQNGLRVRHLLAVSVRLGVTSGGVAVSCGVVHPPP